eukprot:12621-Heterococcus_DN1.PRE.5
MEQSSRSASSHNISLEYTHLQNVKLRACSLKFQYTANFSTEHQVFYTPRLQHVAASSYLMNDSSISL